MLKSSSVAVVLFFVSLISAPEALAQENYIYVYKGEVRRVVVPRSYPYADQNYDLVPGTELTGAEVMDVIGRGAEINGRRVERGDFSEHPAPARTASPRTASPRTGSPRTGSATVYFYSGPLLAVVIPDPSGIPRETPLLKNYPYNEDQVNFFIRNGVRTGFAPGCFGSLSR
jgi:hypothetical protein